MRTVTYSEARGNLKSVLDDVVNDVDTTIITRARGGDAVVMSLENYRHNDPHEVLASNFVG